MAVKMKHGVALGSLSLTPLIDIVFLLLIFFLVATRFADEDRELEVNLPTASEAQPQTATPRQIVINIDAENNIHLGSERVDMEALRDALETAQLNNPMSQTVIIRADRDCAWGTVIAVTNLCKALGFHDDDVKHDTSGSD